MEFLEMKNAVSKMKSSPSNNSWEAMKEEVSEFEDLAIEST